ncbi:hypothetical protein LCGC14_2030710 [marine sediment metagenome]|uniref:Uncharacterized protein n=1 Tax=marine sediment metagenome TaxID=412755 RepID=A0A0F9EUT7_9ZZZZ
MITLKEIQVQEALGSVSKGSEIAILVRATEDPKAILWASRHKYGAVRTAAAESPLIPFAQLLRLYFCDSSSTVKDACKESIAERNQEFEQLLEVMEEFPQMSLQLGYRNGSYDFVNLMADEGYDPVERCTEMAVQDPDFSEIINMRGKIKKR